MSNSEKPRERDLPEFGSRRGLRKNAIQTYNEDDLSNIQFIVQAYVSDSSESPETYHHTHDRGSPSTTPGSAAVKRSMEDQDEEARPKKRLGGRRIVEDDEDDEILYRKSTSTNDDGLKGDGTSSPTRYITTDDFKIIPAPEHAFGQPTLRRKETFCLHPTTSESKNDESWPSTDVAEVPIRAGLAADRGVTPVSLHRRSREFGTFKVLSLNAEETPLELSAPLQESSQVCETDLAGVESVISELPQVKSFSQPVASTGDLEGWFSHNVSAQVSSQTPIKSSYLYGDIQSSPDILVQVQKSVSQLSERKALLKQQNAKLEQENQDLRFKLEEKTIELASQKSKASQSKVATENVALKFKIIKAEEETEDAQRERDAATEQLASLESEIIDLDRRAVGAERQALKLEEQLALAKAELAAVEEALQRAQSSTKTAQLQQSLDEAQQQLAAERAKISKSTENFERLVKAMQAKLDAHTKTIAEMALKVANSEADQKTLASQEVTLSTQKAIISRLRAKLRSHCDFYDGEEGTQK